MLHTSYNCWSLWKHTAAGNILKLVHQKSIFKYAARKWKYLLKYLPGTSLCSIVQVQWLATKIHFQISSYLKTTLIFWLFCKIIVCPTSFVIRNTRTNFWPSQGSLCENIRRKLRSFSLQFPMSSLLFLSSLMELTKQEID